MSKPSREQLKWDKGKPKYHLLLTDFLNEMAIIMTKGEENHPKVDGQPSWQLVEPEAYLDAAYRHLHALRKGEMLDQEMGTHHAAHIAVNAMFLFWFYGGCDGNNK